MSREADLLRLKVLKMGYLAGSGHMGGSLSCAELMSVLFDCVLRVDPRRPDQPDRDRLIISKGHAAPMLYACLSRAGFFEEEELYTLRDLGSRLQGHPSMTRLPGIDMSAGSLGLGLSAGVGMALALAGTPSRVYVLLGDGEMQEGQNWEAMMSIVSFGLTNITPIIDENCVQLDGRTEDIQKHQSPLNQKFTGFGLSVIHADGHDEASIQAAFAHAQAAHMPNAIVARTVKGKGVSFMEGKSEWHGKTLDDAHYAAAVSEIEARL